MPSAQRIIQSGSKPVSDFSLAASSNTGPTTAQITIPAGAQAGDWCVIACASIADTTTAPSGYTELMNDVGLAAIYAKKLVAGEPGSDVTVFDGATSSNRTIAAVFRPVGRITSFAAGEVFDTDTDANTAVTPAIAVVQYWCVNADVSPRTASPAMDEVNGADGHHYLKYKIYARGSTPVDHSVDMDDEGNVNVLQSGFVEFT
jgi:hypothetical protein